MGKAGSNLKGTKTNPSPHGARRWQVCLSKLDERAVAYLLNQWSSQCSTLACAFRRAIHLAAGRHPEAVTAAQRKALLAVLETVREQAKAKGTATRLGRSTGEEKLHQWSVWMGPEDFTGLADIRQIWCGADGAALRKNSEAARFAIRSNAIIEGFNQGEWT